MLEEINKALESYGWTVKGTEIKFVLSNSKGVEVSKIQAHSKGTKYRILDMGDCKLLTGNGKLLDGILKVMKEYYYAKPKQ
jgi:hypothetical protein